MQLDPGTETVFFRQSRSLVRVYSYPSGLASGMMCHWNLPRSPPPRPLLSFLVNRSMRKRVAAGLIHSLAWIPASMKMTGRLLLPPALIFTSFRSRPSAVVASVSIVVTLL